jgi:hypothetical protein
MYHKAVFILATMTCQVAMAAPVYLGLWDNAASVTRFGQYDSSAQTLNSIASPFSQYSFLACSPDGTVYGTDGPNLYTLDLQTGAATLVGAFQQQNVTIECSGMTFKADGTMFVHEYSNRTGTWSHRLFTCDPATAALTFAVNITGVTGLYGIEFANGVLYGSYDNALYTIDSSTGQATLVGTSVSAWDMDFGLDGILRGSSPSGVLCAIDRTSGTSTVIRDLRTTDNMEPLAIVTQHYVAMTCTLTGRVVLQDFVGDVTKVPVRIKLIQNGEVVRDETLYLDSTGQFVLENVPPGVYDVWVKASHWLSQRKNGIIVTVTSPGKSV